MVTETSEILEGWMSKTLSFLAVMLGLICVMKYLFTSSVLSNIPPFPTRGYPLLGHLPYLKNGLKEPLDKWRKSTGDIFSLYFGSQLVVILNSYEVVYDAFVKHGDTLSDRPRSFATNSSGADPNTGIVTASGKGWKEQRTVTLHILRSFGMGKNVLAVKISEEISAYLDALSALSGQPSDVRTLTTNAVSNIICSIIVGKRFEYDDDYFITFITKMEELFKLTRRSSLSTLFPWLRFIPGDLADSRKRRKLFEYVMDFFCCHYIEKTKKEDDELDKENFISAYLLEKKKLDKQGLDNNLNEDQLARIILQLFFAGTSSTSTVIQWFMLYMLHYPDIQKKIYAEISELVGLERAPNMQDRTKLSLLNAAIMECQRITTNPINLPHYSSADTVINGYTIPAGTTVISNLHSILMSEDTWEHPTEFNPQRFLDAHGNLVPPEQFMPFGVGRRACPGESVAKMELFLFLTSLIQRFELKPAAPDQLPELKSTQGIVAAPMPFQIRFVDRRDL